MLIGRGARSPCLLQGPLGPEGIRGSVAAAGPKAHPMGHGPIGMGGV